MKTTNDDTVGAGASVDVFPGVRIAIRNRNQKSKDRKTV
jgi:hypothetical protein